MLNLHQIIRDEIIRETQKRLRTNGVDTMWIISPHDSNHRAYTVRQNLLIIISFCLNGIRVFIDNNMEEVAKNAYTVNPTSERLFPYEDPTSIEDAIELITSVIINSKITSETLSAGKR